MTYSEKSESSPPMIDEYTSLCPRSAGPISGRHLPHFLSVFGDGILISGHLLL